MLCTMQNRNTGVPGSYNTASLLYITHTIKESTVM
jgi:hypothetical protein